MSIDHAPRTGSGMGVDRSTRTGSGMSSRAKAIATGSAAAVFLAGGAALATGINAGDATPATVQQAADTPYDAAALWVDSIPRTHERNYPSLDREDRSGRLVPCPTDTPNCIGWYARSQERVNEWALYVYTQQRADGLWEVVAYDRAT